MRTPRKSARLSQVHKAHALYTLKKVCPPHTFPHELPWKGKIANEPCHTHKSKARQFIHDFHCWLMQCPYRNWK